jgi:hypothetical protein
MLDVNFEWCDVVPAVYATTKRLHGTFRQLTGDTRQEVP